MTEIRFVKAPLKAVPKVLKLRVRRLDEETGKMAVVLREFKTEKAFRKLEPAFAVDPETGKREFVEDRERYGMIAVDVQSGEQVFIHSSEQKGRPWKVLKSWPIEVTGAE